MWPVSDAIALTSFQVHDDNTSRVEQTNGARGSARRAIPSTLLCVEGDPSNNECIWVLSVDGGAVLEREADRPVSFDGGVVDEDVPDARAELGHLIGVDISDGLQVVAHGGVAALLVGDLGTDLLEPAGGLLELGFQRGEACPVIILVLQGVSVRIDLFDHHGLQAFDGDAEFFLLGFQLAGVHDLVERGLDAGGDGRPLLDVGGERGLEGVLDLLGGQVWHRLGMLNPVFVVALPDDRAVLVGRVPYFRPVPGATHRAAQFHGERVWGTLAFAGFELVLHQIPRFRVDDRLVGSGHIVLGDLALVLDLLFGQEVSDVGLLQERVTTVFLVGEDRLDRVCVPFFAARPGDGDTLVGEGDGDAMHGIAGKEHAVDAADEPGLFWVDLGAAVGAFVVAEEVRVGNEHLPVCEAFLDPPPHVLGDGLSFCTSRFSACPAWSRLIGNPR